MVPVGFRVRQTKVQTPAQVRESDRLLSPGLINKSWHTSSEKGQAVNVPGSVAIRSPLQLLMCAIKVQKQRQQYVNERVQLHPHKTLSTITVDGQGLARGLYSIDSYS